MSGDGCRVAGNEWSTFRKTGVIQSMALCTVRAANQPAELLTDDLDDDIPLPRAVVKVDQNNLLPCPQLHVPVVNRDAQ